MSGAAILQRLVANNALPAIADERIETTELVLDHRPAPDLALRASVYQWSLRDMVVWGDPDRWFVSGPPVRSRGAEVSADRRWASGVQLRASLSLQDARMQGGQRLVNAPRWLGKLHCAAPQPAGARSGGAWLAARRRPAAAGAAALLLVTHVAGSIVLTVAGLWTARVAFAAA